MRKNYIAAEIMRHLCECPKHGYSQGSARWGNLEIETLEIGGNTYKLLSGDRDCSSAVIDAWTLALDKTIPCTYTVNMVQGFLSTGDFSYIAVPEENRLRIGDVLLNERYHTAMVIDTDPVVLGEFWLDSHGGIEGDSQGDQTGTESREVYYYNSAQMPWDGVLRYKGTQEGTIEMTENEFFNHEVPFADGEGSMPIWQYFTWSLEYIKETWRAMKGLESRMSELEKRIESLYDK